MDISHVAKLSKLSISPKIQGRFSDQFEKILEFVSRIGKLNIKDLAETSQVAGLKNVLREDEIDTNRILTQEEALKNAKKIHNGFFIVDSILNQE